MSQEVYTGNLLQNMHRDKKIVMAGSVSTGVLLTWRVWFKVLKPPHSRIDQCRGPSGNGNGAAGETSTFRRSVLVDVADDLLTHMSWKYQKLSDPPAGSLQIASLTCRCERCERYEREPALAEREQLSTPEAVPASTERRARERETPQRGSFRLLKI
ncbi:hypothetical protein Baya_6720 [Bagarius yarrelli]|uniref:Uncharacterized protein n=1 Tax=Bagarius yarrelli TaxID=175774 RepID=A0A556U1N5_BAGYA|nr:hypothetical protein Baya_6720 [Bagarius yarrelli]